jgi:hypothetical protein
MRPQGLVEPLQVDSRRQLDRAELSQMVGNELHVQEREPADPEPGDKMDEGDLAGIGFNRKHALAEKCASERQSVEAASQSSIPPRFDAVRVTKPVELTENSAYFRIDPRLRVLLPRRRAGVDHLLELPVAMDFE